MVLNTIWKMAYGAGNLERAIIKRQVMDEVEASPCVRKTSPCPEAGCLARWSTTNKTTRLAKPV
jgi:hypothetical protein